MTRRPALTSALVVTAAVAVADRGGLSAVSMRNVGRELGVEAMSLYHHVAGKEALVDELADWAFRQIPLPDPDGSWREAMVERAHGAREVLRRHPWALGLLESRQQPGPAVLRHHDAVLGCLRRNGFSVTLAGHAFSVLDAYVYGFVLTELNLPMTDGESAAEFAVGLELAAADYPYLVEMITERVVTGRYAYADEFGHGLDLILDALAAQLSGAIP